jgi:hypothetical protein
MTFDTFETLKVGNGLKPVGKARIYPVTRIGKNLTNRKVVYVCLNPTAVEKRKDTPIEFGIFASEHLDHKTHYLNWERVL